MKKTIFTPAKELRELTENNEKQERDVFLEQIRVNIKKEIETNSKKKRVYVMSMPDEIKNELEEWK
jgi:hypothetical protein